MVMVEDVSGADPELGLMAHWYWYWYWIMIFLVEQAQVWYSGRLELEALDLKAFGELSSSLRRYSSALPC